MFLCIINNIHLFISDIHLSAISVLHDVCITQLGGCNRAFTYDRVFRKKSDLYNVKVKKVYPGVTAMLTANHGDQSLKLCLVCTF